MHTHLDQDGRTPASGKQSLTSLCRLNHSIAIDSLREWLSNRFPSDVLKLAFGFLKKSKRSVCQLIVKLLLIVISKASCELMQDVESADSQLIESAFSFPLVANHSRSPAIGGLFKHHSVSCSALLQHCGTN